MSESTYPENIQYTDKHTWFREESDGTVTIGITDYAQDQLGEVAFVDLPDAGAEFGLFGEFGAVESIKSVSTLFMPIAGKVVAVNDELSSDPSLVNTSPYAEGWMLRVLVADDADRSHVQTAAAYAAENK